jgi:hypothetical protein
MTVCFGEKIEPEAVPIVGVCADRTSERSGGVRNRAAPDRGSSFRRRIARRREQSGARPRRPKRL